MLVTKSETKYNNLESAGHLNAPTDSSKPQILAMNTTSEQSNQNQQLNVMSVILQTLFQNGQAIALPTTTNNTNNNKSGGQGCWKGKWGEKPAANCKT